MLNLRAASHLSNLAFFHSLRSFQKMLDLRLDLASSTNSEFLKQRSLLVPLHIRHKRENLIHITFDSLALTKPGKHSL